MKKLIILLPVVLLLITACADRDRKNPLDPKNSKSQRTQAVLVELFTSDAPVYYTHDTINVIKITHDTLLNTQGSITSPGTLFTYLDTITFDSLTIPDTSAQDTLATQMVDSSANISTFITTTTKDTLSIICDTLQRYDSLELVVTAAYQEDEVIVAEYHLRDTYHTRAGESLFNVYESAAITPADTFPAAYFNGTGNPVDMHDTLTQIDMASASFSAILQPQIGDISYYTLEGNITTSLTPSSPDSTINNTILTATGKLARLGSDDGDSVIVRYIFTRYLSANHPAVVVGSINNVYQLTAPEAGMVYTLPEQSITVKAELNEEYVHVIIALQDAATGNIIQVTQNRD